MLVLQGCVQSAATPNVNVALERVLATKGIAVLTLADEGCCGALEFHLSAHEDGLQRMRDLIDRLLPVLDDVDHIILAGGTSSIDGLADMVAAKLGTPCSIANPFSNMSLSSRVNEDNLHNDAPAMMIACGLALRSFD